MTEHFCKCSVPRNRTVLGQKCMSLLSSRVPRVCFQSCIPSDSCALYAPSPAHALPTHELFSFHDCFQSPIVAMLLDPFRFSVSVAVNGQPLRRHTISSFTTSSSPADLLEVLLCCQRRVSNSVPGLAEPWLLLTTTASGKVGVSRPVGDPFIAYNMLFQALSLHSQ